MLKTAWFYRLFGLFTLTFAGTFGILLRPDLFGVDAYATWLYIKSLGDFLGYQPLAKILFAVFPDNLLFFKWVMILCAFACVVVLWELVRKRYDERTAWLTIPLLFALSPVLIFQFGGFENEIFAYPLIFLAFYFFYNKKPVVGVIYLALASGFWAGSVFMFLMVAPLSLPALAIFLGICLWLPNDILSFLTIDPDILERIFLSGFSQLFLLVGPLVALFFEKDKRLWLGVGAGLVILALDGKAVMLLVPFAVLGLGKALVMVQERKISLKPWFVVAFLLIIGWNYVFLVQQPTQNDRDLLEVAHIEAKNRDITLLSDWDYAYVTAIKENRVLAFNFYTSNPDYNGLNIPFVGLSQQYNPAWGCEVLAARPSFAREVTVFVCDRNAAPS